MRQCASKRCGDTRGVVKDIMRAKRCDDARASGAAIRLGRTSSHRVTRVSSHHFINILKDNTTVADPIKGFLIQLGGILRRLTYKDPRLLKMKIMNDTLKVKEKAGVLHD
ncbi:hypothetical protein PUN28_019697 [Cardiocondyla obscurior]|uniref:Uncharacterized protein n=1 Tax=Cardiocondyla obscurior TaxID=286306 RepID=A0AAW2EC53_9HYME